MLGQSPRPPAGQLACSTAEEPQVIFHCDVERNMRELAVPRSPTPAFLLLETCGWFLFCFVLF